MFLNAMQKYKRSNKIQNASNCHTSQTASTTLATKPRPQQANTAQYARIYEYSQSATFDCDSYRILQRIVHIVHAMVQKHTKPVETAKKCLK